MAAIVPFKVDLQLYPTKTFNTRWERVRELEKIGVLIHQALVDGIYTTDGDLAINIAQPGGGQVRSSSRFGGECNSVAVKPGFGNYPAQATIVGFYDPNTIESISTSGYIESDDIAVGAQTSANTQLFHCGSVLSGPMGSTPWNNNPTAAVNNEVSGLKSGIENCLASNLPDWVKYKTFRVELRGITFGNSGYTFPH